MVGIHFYNNPSYKALKVLPLVHLAKKDRHTGLNNGELILRDGFIKTKRDDEFSQLTSDEEDLCYFFYGKPAYKEPKGYDPSDPPIVFILNSPDNPKRVFPFDTGAFLGGRYSRILGDDYLNNHHLMEWQLLPDINIIGKYLYAFWKTNKSYYKNKPNIHKNISSINNNFIKLLVKLIKAKDTPECDERKHSVEIQFDKNIELNKNLKLILVSNRTIRKNPSILEIFAKNNIKIIFYHDNNEFRKVNTPLFVYNEIFKYYKKNGYFRS